MFNELDSDPNDDEMFLNEDEFADIKQSKLKKKEKLFNSSDPILSATENVHVIFKRPFLHLHHQSDFGMSDLSQLTWSC